MKEGREKETIKFASFPLPILPNHPFPQSKSKSKQSSPTTRHGGAWGKMRYSSYSFMTSALDGGEWSRSRPGRALPPGKGPPVPIVQEAGWAPEPVWTQRLEENPLPLPGIEPRSPGRPALSQTLYCLSYPCSHPFPQASGK
jgi:hypothetical protein